MMGYQPKKVISYEPKVPMKTDDIDWDSFFDEIDEHEKQQGIKDTTLKEFLMKRFQHGGYDGKQLTSETLGNMISDAIVDYDEFKNQVKKRTRKNFKVKD